MTPCPKPAVFESVPQEADLCGAVLVVAEQDATWCHLRLVIIIVNKAHTRGLKGDIINLSNLATVWDTEIYFLDSSSLSQEILSCKSCDRFILDSVIGCFLTKQVEGKPRGTAS